MSPVGELHKVTLRSSGPGTRCCGSAASLCSPPGVREGCLEEEFTGDTAGRGQMSRALSARPCHVRVLRSRDACERHSHGPGKVPLSASVSSPRWREYTGSPAHCCQEAPGGGWPVHCTEAQRSQSWREDSLEPVTWVRPSARKDRNTDFWGNEDPTMPTARVTCRATCRSRADQEMALTWRLLLLALLAPWGSGVTGVTGAEETVPLKTLRCYNDYSSHIACRWADTRDAQRLLNLTLHRGVNGDPPEPVSCGPSEDEPSPACPAPPCVHRSCRIPYRDFVIADDDFYFFQADRPLGVQLSVLLTQHVQPPPPKDLQISTTRDHFLLTWSLALGDPQTPWLAQGDLEFEVVYRQLSDSWEDATSLRCSSSQAVLGTEHLVPSSTYVARVRTLLAPGSRLSGRPSQWSPEILWDSQPGDEAQPRNLQCAFDGAHTLTCSWELRSPVAGSLSFGLFYTASPEAQEEECAPVLTEALSGLDTRFRCLIPVADPAARGLYVISVRPRREGRFIKSSEHIQMEHPTLWVTKDRGSYSLRWQVEKMYYSHIEHTFQVQYRRDAEPWEDSKRETLRSAHSMALPALQPSTKYWARVRVRPTPGAYDGIWSEWSEEQSWTTDWVLTTWVLALILVIVTLLLLLVLRFCGVYGYRLNRKWKEKIPNPGRSHLFQNGGAGAWPPDSLWAAPSGGPPPQGPWDSLFPELGRAPSAEFGDCEVSPLTTEDPKVACSPPSGPSAAPADSGPPPEPPPSPGPGPPAPSSRSEHRLPSFDFNGPYLGPPYSGSLPDLPGQPEPPQSHRPALASSLEYLCLPPGGQVQLVPLAQVVGQGQAVEVEAQPGPLAQGDPCLESRGGPAPPVPKLSVEAQDPRPSPAALPVSSGDPEVPGVASDYVTTADLALALPTGAPSVSLAPRLGLPLVQNPSLCPRPPGGPPAAPHAGKPGFEGYVELPATMSQCPRSSLGSPASPVSSTRIPSPGEPREEVALPSPHAEGLLVLQQVGDYCFLPGLGSGPMSPQSKPSSPGPCPELGDPGQVFPIKKPPGQPRPQVPAIQLFKSLKHQDYLPGTEMAGLGT